MLWNGHKWAFKNYVDKKKLVDGTGNINDMQVFPNIIAKKIFQKCQPRVDR